MLPARLQNFQAGTAKAGSGSFWCWFRSCPHAAAASVPAQRVDLRVKVG